MRRSENKEIILPVEDFYKTYPSLQGYFEEYPDALFYKGVRQLNAAEKIARFGGSEQVKKNILSVEENFRNRYTVLLACRDGYMTGYSIREFGATIGNRMGTATIYETIARIEAEAPPKLDRQRDLTYFYKINPNDLAQELRPGYKTIGTGVEELVTLQSTPSRLGIGQPGLIPTEAIQNQQLRENDLNH